MTHQEAKQMEGTEFTYIFENGDSMPAYVKKVDLETGRMSCWSFSLTTTRGVTFPPMNKDEEKEGACCVLISKDWETTLKRLTEIKGGSYKTPSYEMINYFSGCIF